MRRVFELAFTGEGVGVEPVEQLFAIRADHAGLRQMDVGVDEPGSDQRIRVFDQGHIIAQGAEQFLGRAHGLDDAVFDHQQAVGKILIRLFHRHLCRVGDAVDDGGSVSGTA